MVGSFSLIWGPRLTGGLRSLSFRRGFLHTHLSKDVIDGGFIHVRSVRLKQTVAIILESRAVLLALHVRSTDDCWL